MLEMKYYIQRNSDGVIYPPPAASTDDVIINVQRAGQASMQSSIGSSVVSRDTKSAAAEVARRGRLFAMRQQRRLVFKDGACNVANRGVTQRRRRYLTDLFTTLVDLRWRYQVVMFALAFIVSWLAFAVVWWLIAFVHGDLQSPGDEEATDADAGGGEDVTSSALKDDAAERCAENVVDFRSALLFSIETQHTIGYGGRAMNTACPHAICVMMIQSCVGVFIQCLITGVVFSKLSRPKSRAQTLLFSRRAVICVRDNQYCLLLRVADMRRSYIVGASIRMLMIKNRLTDEGEVIPLCQSPMSVETDSCCDGSFLFLVWPVTVLHRIDSSSPLWDVSAEQLVTERFEIIVVMEGTVESNGRFTQVRTSYLPGEILWGHRPTPLVTYEKNNGRYDIDYTQFHQTIAFHMPDVSARQYSVTSSTDGHVTAFPYYPSNFTLPSLVSTPRQVYRRARRRQGQYEVKGQSSPRSSGEGSVKDVIRHAKSADDLCAVAARRP